MVLQDSVSLVWDSNTVPPAYLQTVGEKVLCTWKDTLRQGQANSARWKQLQMRRAPRSSCSTPATSHSEVTRTPLQPEEPSALHTSPSHLGTTSERTGEKKRHRTSPGPRSKLLHAALWQLFKNKIQANHNWTAGFPGGKFFLFPLSPCGPQNKGLFTEMAAKFLKFSLPWSE